MAKLYRHTDARLDNEIDNIYLSIKDLPIGTIMGFLTPDDGDNANYWPDGWLSCKAGLGRTYPTSEYQELSILLGKQYQISDTLFTIPSMSPVLADRIQRYIKAK